MTVTVLSAFIATCLLLAVTPGPNMALLIATTLSGGASAGLVTLAGTLTGLAILVAVAAIGMTSVMVLMAEWFDVIRWVGAIYLVVLGCRMLWGWWRQRRTATASQTRVSPTRTASAGTLYLQGLAVSLSNPKVLLFLGAFFPQFVSPASAPGPQLALLSVLFVGVLAAVDLTYLLAIARARAAVDMRRLRVLDAFSGVLLLAGGLVLATARQL